MKEQIIKIIENYSPEVAADEILSLFAVISSLPDSDEIRMKARELDEKDFSKWMFEIQKGNDL